MIRFADHMSNENVQVRWAELPHGEFISDAAVAAGTYRKQGTRWVIANRGVSPRRGSCFYGTYFVVRRAETDRVAVGVG